MAKLAFTIDADYQKVIKLREEIDRLKSTLTGMDGNTSPATLRAMETQLAKNTKELDALIQKAADAGTELNRMKGNIRTTTGFLGDMKGALVAIGGTAVLKKLVSDMISVRGEFQKTQVAFETMLGSKEKADTLMTQMVQTAAKTPFDLQGVANGAKQLLAYGTAAEDVNDTLIRLGNIASGLSIPLGDMVYLYGTTQTQGRLFTQDVRQFMGRGIPLVKELATMLGKTEEEINKMVTAGKIGFPEVEKVIKKMTDEGGQFYNLMEKQSETLSGQISNLGDAWDGMLNSIGEKTQGVSSATISMATDVVESYDKVGRILAALIITYGTYKAALIVTNLVLKEQAAINAMVAASNGVFSKSLAYQWVWTERAQKAQSLLNKTMLNNPYVLLGTLVGALVAKMILFNNEQEKTLSRTELLKKITDSYASELAKERSELSLLLSVAKNEKVSKESRLEAIQKLNDISPKYLGNLNLENINTKLATDAVDQYTQSLEKNAKTKAIVAQMQEIEEARLKNAQRLTELAKNEADKDWFNKGWDWLNEAGYNVPVGLKPTSKPSIIANQEEINAIQENNKELEKKYQLLIDINSENERSSKVDATIPKNIQIEIERKNLEYLKEEHAKLVEQINNKPIGVMVDALEQQKLDNYISQIKVSENKIKGLLKPDQSSIQDKKYWEEQKKNATVALDAIDSKIREVLDRGDSKKSFEALIDSGKTEEEAKKSLESYNKAKKQMADADKNLKIYDTTGKADKEANKLLKAQSDLSRSILDSELKLQAGRIAAMEDGKAKRMALAKQEYDEARTQIDKDEQDLLSKKGITKDQKKIVSDNANSLRLQEQQNLLKKNTDIEKSSAKEIQSIWADVNSRFSSGLENRLTEIDKFYEEAIKKAREEGVEEIKIAELISKAKEEKASVKNESFIEKGMQRIAMEEEVAQKHLEIKQDQFVTDSVYQLKRNSLERKFTLDRLNLLKRSIAQEGTERYRQIEDEKKQLSGHLAYLDEYGETLKGEIIQDALSGLSDIAGAIGGLNDDLGETMNNLQQMIGAMAQLASGNYIGAAISAITSVVSSIAKSNQEAIQRAKETEGHYWDAVNWKIERQIELMKELQGISSDQVNQSIQTQIDELMDILYNADFKYKGKSGAEMQWMVENLLGGYKKAVASGNKLAQKVLEGMANGLEGNLFGDKKFDDVLKGLTTEELISLQGIPDVWKVLPEEVQQYIKQLSDAVDKQKELTDTTNEMFTGTAENEIANSILDALSKGKDGVDDFSTYFKDMMKNAMLQGVNMKYLQEPIKKFYEQFSAMSQSDEKLTKTEIDELREMYQQIVDNAQAQFENLKDISGLDFSTPEEGESDNTLKGAYAKASQESIDLLAGQTGASRVVLEDIRNNMQPIREQMKLIYDMQVRGWEDVKAIRDLSDKVEKNTNRIAENTQEIKTVADKISDNTKRTVETLEGRIDVNIKGM